MRFSLTPVGGYLLVALAAAVLLALLLVGPGGNRLSIARRRVLTALRLAAVAVLLLVMLRPALVHTRIQKQSSTLVLLLDRSRSMLVRDMVGGRSRWDVARSTLADAEAALARLGRDVEIKLYLFDAETETVPVESGRVSLESEPDGDQTALGAAIDDVLRRESGKRLAGVVVFSDGAQRAYAPRDMRPQTAARRLADQGFRLYAVGLGQARGLGQVADIRIEDFQAPESVFVKNELGISGAVRFDGFVNQRVPVQLLVEKTPGADEQEVVAVVNLSTPTSGARLPVELDYVPELPGEYKLTLKAAPQPGEQNTANNEASTFISVLKGGLAVLYIEGAPRVEGRFLRRALDASPDVQVDYLRIDAAHPETRPHDLDERLAPGKYDVYILGDVDATAFTTAQLEQLAQAVDRGAGLIMLGGFQSFGPGGYGTSPLAGVLPIEIGRFERQNPGEPIRDDLHIAGPVAMRPTRLGETQSLMLLAGRDANQARWAELPPLDGINRFEGLKPGANTLAATADGTPVLVGRDFGGGRVLAFAGDSTWRWWLEGFEATHRRFWRQTVLWLARKDQSQENNVWVELDARRFAPGSKVEFRLGAQTPEGEPLPDARFTVDVELPDGRRLPARVRWQNETLLGSLDNAQLPGDYLIHVAAEHAGEPIGTAQARFLVYAQDLELDNPAADLGTLDTLARLTEGRSLAPEQLSELLDQLQRESQDLKVETEVKDTLWDKWPVLLLMVGLLSVEWYLRKRWGLV